MSVSRPTPHNPCNQAYPSKVWTQFFGSDSSNENIPVVCFPCGRIGHLSFDCPASGGKNRVVVGEAGVRPDNFKEVPNGDT